MKSIKPGRGPSMMGGFGALASVAFGVIWTLAAINMGAPVFFPLFGLVFIALGVGQAIYNFRNAKGENRYSAFDIVDSDEEDDPLNRRYGARHEDAADSSAPLGRFPRRGLLPLLRRARRGRLRLLPPLRQKAAEITFPAFGRSGSAAFGMFSAVLSRPLLPPKGVGFLHCRFLLCPRPPRDRIGRLPARPA